MPRGEVIAARGGIWAVDGITSTVACKSAHRAPPLLAAARVRVARVDMDCNGN